MKLKKGFVTYSSDGEYIMTGVGEASFGGIVRGNAVAAFIVECIAAEMTREEILDKMSEKYDAPRETLDEGLEKVIGTLRQIGVLDE